MSVPSVYTRVKAIADGVITEFSFNWEFLSEQDIKVYVENELQTLGEQYSLNYPDTKKYGSVVFNSAPISGARIVIKREGNLQQNRIFKNQSSFNANEIEKSYDKLTRLVQVAIEQTMRQSVNMADEYQTDITIEKLNDEQILLYWDSVANEFKETPFTQAEVKLVIDNAVRSAGLTVKNQEWNGNTMTVSFSDNTSKKAVVSDNVCQVRAVQTEDLRWVFQYSFDGNVWNSVLGSGIFHNELLGRDVADSHPITAITGLTKELSDIESDLLSKGSELTLVKGSISTLESEQQNLGQSVQTLGGNLSDLEDKVLQDIKSVSYNGTTGVFTFTKQDGSIITIDTPVERDIKSGYYDSATKELVLVLQDDTEIRIPASDLVKVYTGVDGANIQIVISATNEISAILKNGTINETKLTAQLQATINGKATTVALQAETTARINAVAGVQAEVNTLKGSKQDKLVSSVNIKTINGGSVLGEGDIVISGSGNVFFGTSTDWAALSAEQQATYTDTKFTDNVKPVKFSVNMARREEDGTPSFMEVIGNELVFYGSVMYTQADGVVKTYESVDPLLVAGVGKLYVYLEDGIATISSKEFYLGINPPSTDVDFYNPLTSAFYIFNEQTQQFEPSNKVIIGYIEGGVVTTYEYNTWAGIVPEIATAPVETKSEITGWGMPDYSAYLSLGEQGQFTAEHTGVYYGSKSFSNYNVFSVEVNGMRVVENKSDQAGVSQGGGSFFASKGDIITPKLGLSISTASFWFCPLKGEV